MRRNSESYGRRWASWCWSSTPEKKARGSGRKNRDRLLRVQSQMRTEGYEVSIAQLFEWFSLAGSIFYYRPKNPRPLLDQELVGRITSRRIFALLGLGSHLRHLVFRIGCFFPLYAVLCYAMFRLGLPTSASKRRVMQRKPCNLDAKCLSHTALC